MLSRINQLEQELNKKKIMFDTVTRDRKKLEGEVKHLMEQNIKLKRVVGGDEPVSDIFII
jgi:hypothetical protein